MWWITGTFAGVIVLLCTVLLNGCAPLTSFEEVKATVGPEHFIEVDGRQIYVERAGDGEPAVVLLHGFAASSYTFRKIIPLLGERHRVLAIDWYGFGWTERPSDRNAYSLSGQLAMIHRVLEMEGISRAHLVGHSFGAVLANRYAEMYPQTVASITFLSPPVEFNTLPRLLEWWPGRALFYPFLRLFISDKERFADFQRNTYHKPDQVAAKDLEAYRQRLLVEGLWDALHGFLSGSDQAPDRSQYGVDGIPLMILAGRHDPVVPLETIRRMQEGLPGVTFHVLQQSAHNAPEEEPNEVAERLTEFFKIAVLRSSIRYQRKHLLDQAPGQSENVGMADLAAADDDW